MILGLAKDIQNSIKKTKKNTIFFGPVPTVEMITVHESRLAILKPVVKKPG